MRTRVKAVELTQDNVRIAHVIMLNRGGRMRLGWYRVTSARHSVGRGITRGCGWVRQQWEGPFASEAEALA